MTQICTKCETQYELGPGTLPECPECIRHRFKHPEGIKPKHTLPYATQSKSFSSYIGDAVDPVEVFDYMAYGPHTSPSGCEVFYSKSHDSFNAVSFKPLGQIPGSGIQAGHPCAMEFAVLVDLQGRNNDGPHLTFEASAHLQNRIDCGEWSPAPKCTACGEVYMYTQDDKCINCKQQRISYGPDRAENVTPS